MPIPDAQKALQLARVTGELLKRSQLDQEKRAAVQTAVNALIPDVVDALVKNERIFPHQKEAVASALSDHAKCLDALMKLAAHRTAGEVQTIGKPVPTDGQVKRASVITGEHLPIEDTVSGQTFLEMLMRGKS